MDTVAIIINSYRENPLYLETAIKSCLAQTGVKVRLIISTVEGDPAESAAKKLCPDVLINKLKAPGIYEQLNAALPLIGDADWYHYFSGNDYAEPGKDIGEINACVAQGKKICYSNYVYTNAFLRCDKNSTNLSHPYNFVKHLTGNFIPDWAIMRTEIIRKYAPFKLEHGNYAYWDFWLRVFEGEGDVFAFNNAVNVRYRIVETSKHVMRRKNKKEKSQYEIIRNAMLATHKK